MNILVTGATGAVGPGVVQALRKVGHAVRTFSLDRPPLRAFPPNVDERTGDVTDVGVVQAGFGGYAGGLPRSYGAGAGTLIIPGPYW